MDSVSQHFKLFRVVHIIQDICMLLSYTCQSLSVNLNFFFFLSFFLFRILAVNCLRCLRVAHQQPLHCGRRGGGGGGRRPGWFVELYNSFPVKRKKITITIRPAVYVCTCCCTCRGNCRLELLCSYFYTVLCRLTLTRRI